ncbi:GNAT family N-acetyltransferase [Mammaliicoccus stepanovicii]|uniref:GNAT family acetyltransferase n=1 Tax=Mammaliicoccus stepanovicii TaxID=643214 RepID=A0A239YK07_9STAP|nr:GNAT family N-acetyltransferase [Mammaliicoccus stepanovicii]PNZ77878.1 N-acetyltransferase [Mammaliicoccus stepanovicii]GGI40929.1 N-acetyltransferase [Mammaliicoccus stepanovicii]SNV58753.1 GNAT family acetyltransferase [Mammaliicoccus stepanovicii]
MVEFKDIVTDGDILINTDRYIHYQTLTKRIQYDSNKLVYKVMPDLAAFKEDEAYLNAIHRKHNQPFLKFVFPENCPLEDDLKSYLSIQGYEYSWLELYINDELDFKIKENTSIQVMETNEDNLVDYLNLSYEFDKQYGTDYAELKIEVNKAQFESESPVQVISYYNGNPSGILLIWPEEDYVELDAFSVRENLRRLGIGTKMQDYVAKYAGNRPIVLVAEGEDTAKDMYKNQGYKYSGYRYEALKEFK